MSHGEVSQVFKANVEVAGVKQSEAWLAYIGIAMVNIPNCSSTLCVPTGLLLIVTRDGEAWASDGLCVQPYPMLCSRQKRVRFRRLEEGSPTLKSDPGCLASVLALRAEVR